MIDPERARSAYRLLVVAPNWLGDLVMATPLLDALSDSPPLPDGRDLTLDIAVRRRWLQLLTGDPRGRAVPWQRTGQHGSWFGIWRLARAWRAHRYDAAILLPPSFRVALAAALAGIPQRIGYRSDGRGALLTHGVKRSPRGSVHYSQEMLHLGAVWAQQYGLDHQPPVSKRWPSLPGCTAIAPGPEVVTGPPIWVLAAGATFGPAKSWPASQAGAFVDRVVGSEQARVILMGDESARLEAEAIRACTRVPWRTQVAGPAGGVDLTGRTDLTAAVTLLKGATIFVGIDSGLMHLAAALALPTVGLFGATSPAWTAPRGEHTRVMSVRGFACQPCFRRRCNQETFCMTTLSGEAVFSAARDLLAGTRAGES